MTDVSSTSNPRVSVIVVSYNTREMTLECLRSTVSETKLDFELLVVDNASSDGSAEAIAEACPTATLFAEKENMGFAKANNFAAQRARGDYLLLLNPDTVVLDQAIDKLVAFAESCPQAAIWGGRTLYGDRSLNATSCFRRMTLYGLTCQFLGLNSLMRGSAIFNPEHYGGWQRDTERGVDIVTGCFLLIRRKLWNELGGFDTKFVMYGEESDLCLRARKLGARPRVTPNAQIIHYGGASQKIRADRVIRLLRGKISLVERHFGAWTRPLALMLLRLWPASRAWTSRLTRSPVESAWEEIWSRRAEWWHGWFGINR